MNIRKEIGGKIRAIREEKGLSQEELAGMAKVARRTVVNIEQGAFNPKLETVNDIARALDCRVRIVKQTIKSKTMKTTTYQTNYQMFIETLQELEKSRKNLRFEIETRKQDAIIFVRVSGSENELLDFVHENGIYGAISEISEAG